MRVIGEIDSGRVSEQRVLIDAPDESGTLVVRRIRLELHQPTRDGDDTLYLLTTVPAGAADACTLARLYRERWTLEKAFLHLTMQLRLVKFIPWLIRQRPCSGWPWRWWPTMG
jgi:hypothetical protein